MEIGWEIMIPDPDVYHRPTHKVNWEEIYEFLLVYIDNLLCISPNPE